MKTLKKYSPSNQLKAFKPPKLTGQFCFLDPLFIMVGTSELAKEIAYYRNNNSGSWYWPGIQVVKDRRNTFSCLTERLGDLMSLPIESW